MVTRMKTTIELADALFDQVKAQAKTDGRTIRSVLEEALRAYLEARAAGGDAFVLRDVSYGKGWLAPEVASASLGDLVDASHEERFASLER
jgi:hypothetical protein